MNHVQTRWCFQRPSSSPIVFHVRNIREYARQINITEACRASGVTCLVWRLIDNHVHLILVPHDAGGLRAALAEAHRRYTRAINFREGWRGYLSQDRFTSYPMDDPLTDVAALGRHVGGRCSRSALEAADDPATVAAIEARSRTGRPLADPVWIAEMEVRLNRALAPAKRGPKPSERRLMLVPADPAILA